MTYISGNTVDQNNVPVVGAQVYVYVKGVLATLQDTSGGVLANPLITVTGGFFEANVQETGKVVLRHFWGSRQRYVEDIGSQELADLAATSAAVAESASGPNYSSTAAGLAATQNGESFAVDNGDGTVTVYLNDSGAAVAQRTLATTVALASSAGGALVGMAEGGTVEAAIPYLTPEQKGAAGDGATDDGAAILSAHNSGDVFAAGSTYLVASPLILTNEQNGLDLERCIITQANSSNVDTLVRVAVTNSSGTALDQSAGAVRVNGNRDNNATEVTGVEFTSLKKANGNWRAVATDCDTGIKVTEQVEYAEIAARAESCGLGFHAQSMSSTTPDELLLTVIAHDCDESLRFDGVAKMSSTTNLTVEGAGFWAGTIYTGWHRLTGLGRGVAETGAGGGLRVRGYVELTGEWKCYGASDTNCQYGLLVEGDYTGTHDGPSGAATLTDSAATWTSGEYVGLVLYNITDGSSGLITANTGTTITATLSGGTENDWDSGDSYRIGGLNKPFSQDFHIVVGANYSKGARIAGDVDGSVRVTQVSSPNSGVGLELGDASLGALNGFVLDPLSTIRGDIVTANARNLLVEALRMVGTEITIGSDVFDCTFMIPQRDAESIAITNNRTQLDNKVIFRGTYTLTQLNGLNSGTLFRGMEAEGCQTYEGQRVFYDGADWRPFYEHLGFHSTADFQSAGSTVNGAGRFTGACATDTTTNTELRFDGTVWRGGGTTVTPV